MTKMARLAAVALDTADPSALAEFYRRLLDLETVFETDDFIALKGAGVLLTAQRVADHVPPDWPGASVPKQAHLELAVEDLAEAERFALSLGAVRPQEQPGAGKWLVLIDPAGHPFCITTLIPKELIPETV